MCMLRMNPQVQKYGRYTPDRRVFGRAPKLPIEATDSPHFKDFTNPNDSPVTQTHDALAKLRGDTQSLLTK